MREFDIYLAGDTRGFPESTPEKMILGYNILLSYTHPTGPKGADLVGKVKRGEAMDLYLVGPEKRNIMDYVTNNGWTETIEVPNDADGSVETIEIHHEGIKSNMLFNFLDGKRATDNYKEQIKPKKLFIDSGAFSAWTKGKEVSVDEYLQWINDRADYIDLCGQVDVIPGDRIKGHTKKQVAEAAEATWQNYLYMRERMINPDSLLYTFHVGEDFSYLRQALEWTDKDGRHIPYIALGGMVSKPTPVRKAFLTGVYSTIEKSSNPNVKTHAFGMTSFDLLERYPITSADSTTWIMTGANGNIVTDVGTIAVSDQMAKLPTHYSHLSKEHQAAFEKTIAEFGFTLNELRRSRDYRIMFNARYFDKKAANLEYKPGPIQKSLF